MDAHGFASIFCRLRGANPARETVVIGRADERGDSDPQGRGAGPIKEQEIIGKRLYSIWSEPSCYDQIFFLASVPLPFRREQDW